MECKGCRKEKEDVTALKRFCKACIAYDMFVTGQCSCHISAPCAHCEEGDGEEYYNNAKWLKEDESNQ